MCLTEERNAVLVPTPGTIIPGAPADWSVVAVVTVFVVIMGSVLYHCHCLVDTNQIVKLVDYCKYGTVLLYIIIII